MRSLGRFRFEIGVLARRILEWRIRGVGTQETDFRGFSYRARKNVLRISIARDYLCTEDVHPYCNWKTLSLNSIRVRKAFFFGSRLLPNFFPPKLLDSHCHVAIKSKTGCLILAY